MQKFFTSDWHLCSKSVFMLAKRSFKNVDRMNDMLIKNANQRASKNDILYHLGDFYNKCTNKNYKCYRQKYTTYLDLIKPQVIMIEGNHDIKNDVRCIGQLLWTYIGKFKVSLGHYPSNIYSYDSSISPNCYKNIGRNHIHICGHVHKNWKYFIDEKNMILNINVGVDVWKYNIVSESELVNYIESILKNDILINIKKLFNG